MLVVQTNFYFHRAKSLIYKCNKDLELHFLINVFQRLWQDLASNSKLLVQIFLVLECQFCIPLKSYGEKYCQ